MNKKAILIGVLIDYFGKIFTTVILVIIAVIIIKSKGLGENDAKVLLDNSMLFSITAALLFLFFTSLGAYITSKIAKAKNLNHALVVGIISLCFGIYAFTTESDPQHPLLFRVLLNIILPIHAALFGGYIYIRKNKNKDQIVKLKNEIPEVENPHNLKSQVLGITLSSIIVTLFFGAGFALMGIFTFVDAWKSGIYKNKNKSSNGKMNLSPLEWGIVMQGMSIIFFPLYLTQRNKLKTKNAGYTFFILTIIVGILIIILKIALNFDKIKTFF